MHMHVDANSRFLIAQGHREIGGFAPDAFERQQIIDIVGYFSLETLKQIRA